MAASRPLGGSLASHSVQQIRNGHSLTFAQHHLDYRTEAGPWFLDITDDVRRAVGGSRLQWGQVTVFSNHTTAAIRIQENEPLLLEDLREFLRQLAPPERYYRHNDFTRRTVHMGEDEPKNGHSHCQHILLSSSETIPLVEGELQLGQWQSIFLVELCGARPRRVTVNILGLAFDD